MLYKYQTVVEVTKGGQLENSVIVLSFNFPFPRDVAYLN